MCLEILRISTSHSFPLFLCLSLYGYIISVWIWSRHPDEIKAKRPAKKWACVTELTQPWSQPLDFQFNNPINVLTIENMLSFPLIDVKKKKVHLKIKAKKVARQSIAWLLYLVSAGACMRKTAVGIEGNKQRIDLEYIFEVRTMGLW